MAASLRGASFTPYVRMPWFGQAQKLRINSLASDNATLVKSSAATLEAIVAFNKNGSARFMKFYDEATLPVVGTDTVDWVLELPSATWITLTFGVSIPYFNGLGFGIVANAADSDDTSISAGDVEGILLYS